MGPAQGPAETTREGRNVNWKFGLAIVLTLALTATLLLGLNLYSLQETVLVLLLVAAGVILVFLFLVTFVLFGEGVRLGFLWLKGRIARIVGMSESHIGPREAIEHSRPLK